MKDIDVKEKRYRWGGGGKDKVIEIVSGLFMNFPLVWNQKSPWGGGSGPGDWIKGQSRSQHGLQIEFYQ